MRRRALTARMVLLLSGVALAATARWLVAVDGPPLPPMRPAGWSSWWTGAPVMDHVAALARPVALLGLAVLAILVLAALVDARRRRTTPVRWHRLLPGAIGAGLLSLATAAVGPPGAGAVEDAGAAAPGGARPAVVVAASGRTAPIDLPVSADALTDAAPADDAPATTLPATHLPWAEVRTGGGPAVAGPDPTAAATTVTVRPGDHLWSIAEAQLTRSLGRDPTDAEVDPYWRALVAANDDRLVVPGDPDLIVPGQEIVLPPR